MMKKIPVLNNVRATISYTYSELGTVARIALPWVVIYAVFTLVFQLLGIGEYLELIKAIAFVSEFPIEGRMMGYDKLSVLLEKLEVITLQLGMAIEIHNVLDKLLRLVAYASAAVALQRYYLLNLDVPKIKFTFGILELKSSLYFAICVALALLIVSLTINVFGFEQLRNVRLAMVYIVVGLVLLFIAARFIMIFPSLAVGDKNETLFTSFTATQGNSWSLFSGLLLVLMSALPMFILKVTIVKLALPIFIIWPTQMMVSMAIVALVVWYMSSSYRFLVEDKTEHLIPI